MLTHRRERPAFTLVELLTAMVVFGIITAAILGSMFHQERFLDSAASAMARRRTLQDAAEVLRHDLRGISPVEYGIYAMLRSAVEFRSPTGASIICSIDGTRTTVGIPPTVAVEGALTSWATPPQAADTVLVYDGSEAPWRGHWSAHALIADPGSGGICPMTSGFTRSATEAAKALTLRLSPPLGPDVAPGAPLRFVRRARYQLYRATDGHWYLGYLDCLASRPTPCATIQPVSGPFDSDAVQFTYIDSAGAITSAPERVARIGVLGRATDSRAPRAGASARAPKVDSLAITIALRNR